MTVTGEDEALSLEGLQMRKQLLHIRVGFRCFSFAKEGIFQGSQGSKHHALFRTGPLCAQ